jgi:hypothetical protein
MNRQQAVSIVRRMVGNPTVDQQPDYRFLDYIREGLQALNRRVGFYSRTGDRPLPLSLGVNEYLLPDDVISIQWVLWNGNHLLQKSDQDEWRRRGVDFLQGAPGSPQEWCHWTNKLLLYPAPDQGTISQSPTLTLRYVAAHPDVIPFEGIERLNVQDQRIPLLYAAMSFLSVHGNPRMDPQSLVARIGEYKERFEAEASLIAQQYANRTVMP